MKSANKDDIVEPTDKSFISDVNLYNIQAKIIKELAKQQSCIIIGKCANHLLRDYDNTVSVYIEAPRAFCVKNVIERLGVTEEEAHRMIYQTSYFSRPCNNLRTYEGHKHGSRRVCDDRRIYNICRSADIRKILSRKHSWRLLFCCDTCRIRCDVHPWKLAWKVYHLPIIRARDRRLACNRDISLILQQAARSIFGTQGVNVTAPSFLNGGIKIGGCTFSYNNFSSFFLWHFVCFWCGL